MWDGFHVRGLRAVTNNSFICCPLFYPSFHPIPSSCRISLIIISLPPSLSLFPILSITPLFSPFFCLSPPSPTLQPYYTNRANLPPSSGPRGVPPSSGPRPVTPTHVYQAGPGSQMMMIPGQQLPFASSPQGPAYFIPGQVGCTDLVLVKLPDFLLSQARWYTTPHISLCVTCHLFLFSVNSVNNKSTKYCTFKWP